MSRSHLLRWTIALLAGLVLAGCGQRTPSGGHASHDHDGHHHDEDEGPVEFEEGAGLRLSAETASALGLKTGPVEVRSIRPAYELTASVFDAGPPARASSLVPAEIADDLAQLPPGEASILAIHRELSPAVTQVEIIFAVANNSAVGSTISLRLHGPTRTGPAVPAAALLRTATGAFVYVVNGAHLLRTPVKPGASDGEYVRILDGLQAREVVATAGVEQLWLTELRLTKGGGHSH
jgi:hypothetical protein